jgi:hypothetical protein
VVIPRIDRLGVDARGASFRDTGGHGPQMDLVPARG